MADNTTPILPPDSNGTDFVPLNRKEAIIAGMDIAPVTREEYVLKMFVNGGQVAPEGGLIVNPGTGEGGSPEV